MTAASNAEVDRVLAAKSDLEVMQVKPGSSTTAIKKRYRTMTLALHPDKCKVSCFPPQLMPGDARKMDYWSRVFLACNECSGGQTSTLVEIL